VVGLLQLAAAEGDGAAADLALLVRDDYQRVGLGSLLCRHGIRTAVSLGFTELTARGLAGNDRLVRMLRRLALTPYVKRSDGFVHLRVPLDTAVVAAGLGVATIDLTTPRATAGIVSAA
jgi:GNAT superfamily N-acetyltransferase